MVGWIVMFWVYRQMQINDVKINCSVSTQHSCGLLIQPAGKQTYVHIKSTVYTDSGYVGLLPAAARPFSFIVQLFVLDARCCVLCLAGQDADAT